MSKIVIVGANQGALFLGELLGKQGYDVTLYEKQKKEDVAYPWHDIIAPGIFEQVGLPFPPSPITEKKESEWTFISPDKKARFTMEVPEDKRTVKIHRRPLNDWLYERTKDYAKVVYETEVDSVVVDGDKICGVKLANGKEVKADLVVDCAGANSPIRAKLPASLGIESKIDPAYTFQVRRVFFKRNNDAADPEKTNNLYMRHLAEKGITWVADDKKAGLVDVLIGRTVKLTDETYQHALDDVRADFPIIGEEAVIGGQLVTIPIRHAASLMVADGYAILGDSAFMTIPMMGSGMASSFQAAKILSDVLDGKDDFSKANLYRYQVQFMKENGAKNSGIDVLKNWMIDISGDKLNFLMAKEIIGKKEFSAAGSGNGVQLGFADIMKKVVNGFTRIPLLVNVVGATNKMKAQMAIGAEIPETWDETAFNEWRTKYEENFK